jgi:CO/xanthine dehydrogenase Mo-binding subunit
VLSIDAALAEGPRSSTTSRARRVGRRAQHRRVLRGGAGDVEAGSRRRRHRRRHRRDPLRQHAPIEPHVVASHLDEHGRLVLVSSTQVPFHARRIVAYLLDVPVHRVRVIKPRIGGGFGVKQEILIEDLVALTTLRTGRPARMVYTREQEFVSSRTRHPMRIRVRLGADATARSGPSTWTCCPTPGPTAPTASRCCPTPARRRCRCTTSRPTSGSSAGRSTPTCRSPAPTAGTARPRASTRWRSRSTSSPRLGMDALELRRATTSAPGDLADLPRARRGPRGRRADHHLVRAARLHRARRRAHRLGDQARPRRATARGSTASACRSTCRARASR